VRDYFAKIQIPEKANSVMAVYSIATREACSIAVCSSVRAAAEGERSKDLIKIM
jgi:hypothetical protein